MPSTRDIRRRIKSVKNTAQITKAMQLVAAAKMKKAQDQATNGRAYAELMNKVLVSLRENAGRRMHPFFDEGKGDKTLVLSSPATKALRCAEHQPLQEAGHTKIEGDCRLRHHRPQS
jgi:F-type H+-transporting ATPase subunit gamma